MRLLVLVFSLLFTVSVSAKPVTCFIQVQKSTCWKAYTVKIDVLNADTMESVKSIILDKNKDKVSLKYNCQGLRQIAFSAMYSPVVFAGTENVKYYGKKFYGVPRSLPKDAKYYELPKICFAKDFNKVPMPMGDISDCRCDDQTK